MRSALGGERWLAREATAMAPFAVFAARFCIALIFLANGLGIVDQTRAASELAAHGMPEALVPAFMLGGRALQIAAGAALVIGFHERLAALALAAFLVPATLVAHDFWASPEAERGAQLVNFLKNTAMLGGLLFVAFRPGTRRASS
jgi:putative oxidoreductase